VVLILRVIFIAPVYRTLEMPEFSGTLLALMGLSNGTYMGFKCPALLQQALNEHGAQLETDGVYGPATARR
jgi:hypothetical protein